MLRLAQLALAVVIMGQVAACIITLPGGRGWSCKTDADCSDGRSCAHLQSVMSELRTVSVCLDPGETSYDGSARSWLDLGFWVVMIVGGVIATYVQDHKRKKAKQAGG